MADDRAGFDLGARRGAAGVPSQDVCTTCDGTGRLGRAACPDCQGTGRRLPRRRRR